MSTNDVYAQAAALIVDEDAAPVEGEQPAPETEETEEAPSWQADTSGLDFLEEDDDLPEDPAPPTFEDDDPEPEPDEYEDPAAARLRKDLAKANKQLEWERGQRIQASRKNWTAEAERRFPLADVDSIQADSRRATLKAAAASQTKMEKKLGPILQKVDQLRGEVLTEARQEARAEAAEAWGSPRQGTPSGSDTTDAENAEKYKPSAYKRLEDLTLAKLKGGVLDIG